MLFLYLYRFHENISDYADHKANQIGGAFSKFQNAFKSYMAKDENRELAPEVADMVNKISDAINAVNGNEQQDGLASAGAPTGGENLN
jgi:hypothetical protein